MVHPPSDAIIRFLEWQNTEPKTKQTQTKKQQTLPNTDVEEKEAERLDLACIAGGRAKWGDRLGKQFGGVL